MTGSGRRFIVPTMADRHHDVRALYTVTLSSPCSICFESLRNDRYTAVTNCHHYFHVTCLSGWLKRSSTCPVCRQGFGQCCIDALHVTRRLIRALAKRERCFSLFSRIRIKWWSWHDTAETRVLHNILPLNLVRMEEPCVICSGVMLNDDFSVVTRCGHSFHAECLRRWFNFSFKCPKCPTVFGQCCVDSLRRRCLSLY